MRIFSLLSPVPICPFLVSPSAFASSSCFFLSRRERKISIAISLFSCCKRPCCEETIIPVGICSILTADDVLFTYCPPGPDARNVSTLISSARISISIGFAFFSTATEAVEVCIRPLFSVAGILCTRCTPPSFIIIEYTPLPEISNIISFNPPISFLDELSVFVLQPICSEYLLYILYKSCAKRAASSPPAPARISIIASSPPATLEGTLPESCALSSPYLFATTLYFSGSVRYSGSIIFFDRSSNSSCGLE